MEKIIRYKGSEKCSYEYLPDDDGYTDTCGSKEDLFEYSYEYEGKIYTQVMCRFHLEGIHGMKKLLEEAGY